MSTAKEKEVLENLALIIDPDLDQDIVSLGFIKELTINAGAVSFIIELTTPACPVKEEFRSRATMLVEAIDWVESVAIEMSSRPVQHKQQAQGLAKVRNIIAISSCKGGVGKSTVAVNFAYSLAKTGAKVGIFDADIYGPSLPSFVKVPDAGIYQQDGLICPLEYEGVKLMSFGFVNQDNEAAIMRGPMVSNVIGQLLTGADWGELDYLIVDFPPGTGDIHLTLMQNVEINAAVIVTTPQTLSFIDVVKGIKMFDQLKVPSVAVVENMSYFTCDDCDKKHQPFGSGAGRKLQEMFGFRKTFTLPILPQLSRSSEEHVPAVLADPAGMVARDFADLTSFVTRELSRIQFKAETKPLVTYQEDEGVIVRQDKDWFILDPKTLRCACRCAACIDEYTGKKVLEDDKVPAGVHPSSIAAMGNYAVSVHWSDGHSSSVYPYDVLLGMKLES